MNADLMYAEEAPFDILQIGTPFSHSQNHDYTAKISIKTVYDPHNSEVVNGRRCNGNQNQYSGVQSSKRRFTVNWHFTNEMGTKKFNDSIEVIKVTFTGVTQPQICPTSQTTGGKATKITEHSECTFPPPIPNNYSRASRTVTSLYDFATPNQAFNALFGNKNHVYYCPLLDDEIDQEILMTFYKQTVTKLRKQFQ